MVLISHLILIKLVLDYRHLKVAQKPILLPPTMGKFMFSKRLLITHFGSHVYILELDCTLFLIRKQWISPSIKKLRKNVEICFLKKLCFILCMEKTYYILLKDKSIDFNNSQIFIIYYVYIHSISIQNVDCCIKYFHKKWI